MADPTLQPNECGVLATEDIQPGASVYFTGKASLTLWFARPVKEGEMPSGIASTFIAKGEIGKVTVRGSLELLPPDLSPDVYLRKGE